MEVVDSPFDVAMAKLQLGGDLGRVASDRIEALEGGRQVGRVALQAPGGPGQQLLQVGAGFGIEGGEELLEVDIRGGVRKRHRVTARYLTGSGRAGIDLDGHVLQGGLGAQQHRRVAVDVVRILWCDVHRHQRRAFVCAHACDFADLGAGDRHRLTLTGRDRLGGAEFGLQRHIFFAEHGEPARQRQPLLREDVAADQQREDDHHKQRDERRAVACDLVTEATLALMDIRQRGLLAAHPPLPSAGPRDAGPLRFCGACL